MRQDFAKILVITHIDEIKDAFSMHIEVGKNPRGSAVRIISNLDQESFDFPQKHT